MVTVNLAHAKSHLSDLLNQVEGGTEVVITRHGRPIARVTAVAPPKRPVGSLAAFRAKMPPWRGGSASRLRELRDEGL